MGHTVWSQRIALDVMIDELKSYGKAMKKADREIFEKLLKKSYKHYGSMAYANSHHIWAFFLLSIIIEQDKELRKYERLFNGRVSKWELDNSLG